MDDLEFEGEGSAPRVKRRIVQTTGSHESQFYWYASGDGRRLSALLIYYRLLDERRWGPLDGCCISPPMTGQESGSGRWNRVCNRCHATHSSPRIGDDDGDGYYDRWDTHVTELGIACEACHGPGGAHAEGHRNPFARYAAHGGGAGADNIVNPEQRDHERSTEVCAQCHGIFMFPDDETRFEWRETGFSYRPGDNLHDSRLFSTEGDGQFWSDGMIRVSGREYNGLARTHCFIDGEMYCRSCPIMHPAPANSTCVSASSATMSTPVHRRARSPPVPPRPPSFSTSFTSVFDTWSAGASPKSTPVARQIAAMKANTVPSIVNSIQYGLPTSWVAASNQRTPATASPKPATPARPGK